VGTLVIGDITSQQGSALSGQFQEKLNQQYAVNQAEKERFPSRNESLALRFQSLTKNSYGRKRIDQKNRFNLKIPAANREVAKNVHIGKK
jgi:hypothetical protein